MPNKKFCRHYSNGRCKDRIEEVRHKGGSHFRMSKCKTECLYYEEDPEKLLKHYKCPNCAHFHVEYAVWGSMTFCNRTGEMKEQDWQKEHCTYFKLKTDKK